MAPVRLAETLGAFDAAVAMREGVIHVAWHELFDHGDDLLHLTRVGPDGAVASDRVVGSAVEISDLALAAGPSGFVMTYMDRDGTDTYADWAVRVLPLDGDGLPRSTPQAVGLVSDALAGDPNMVDVQAGGGGYRVAWGGNGGARLTELDGGGAVVGAARTVGTSLRTESHDLIWDGSRFVMAWRGTTERIGWVAAVDDSTSPLGPGLDISTPFGVDFALTLEDIWDAYVALFQGNDRAGPGGTFGAQDGIFLSVISGDLGGVVARQSLFCATTPPSLIEVTRTAMAFNGEWLGVAWKADDVLMYVPIGIELPDLI
jgi:hypothetical protein